MPCARCGGTAINLRRVGATWTEYLAERHGLDCADLGRLVPLCRDCGLELDRRKRLAVVDGTWPTEPVREFLDTLALDAIAERHG